MLIADAAPTEIVQRIYALAERQYSFTNGWTAKREGKFGEWVLRNEKGEVVDEDKFRHDLFKRHGLVTLDTR